MFANGWPMSVQSPKTYKRRIVCCIIPGDSPVYISVFCMPECNRQSKFFNW
jgi:hypothetical protein